jgi:multiple sugar transport system substrate-binding protein
MEVLMKLQKALHTTSGWVCALALVAVFAAGIVQEARAESITVTGVSSFRLIEEFIPQFEKETGVTVNLQILPYDQIRQKSMADLVGGTANSDVYGQDIIWLGEWATNKYVRPLDDLINRDRKEVEIEDILPGAFNALSRWNGKIWSMPFGAYYFLMYYRTDWFREKGLSAPVTLDDIDGAAAKLTDKKNNRYGISMPYRRGGPITSWFLATYAAAGGNLLTNPPKDFTPTLTSARALTVLKHYLKWRDYAPASAIDQHWQDQTIAMQSGQLGMAGTFSINGAEFAKPDVSAIAGKVGYTYMPRLNAKDAPVIPFGGWALAINAKTAKVEASWKFLKWAASTSLQKQVSKVSGTPVRFSALSDPDLQKRYPWLEFVLKAEKSGQVFPDYRPRYPFYPKMEETLGLLLNQAALGQLTAEEALAKANKEVGDIIRNSGHPVK